MRRFLAWHWKTASTGPVSRSLFCATRFIGGDERRRAPAQALQVDPARGSEVAHGEVHGRERHLLGETLVPGRAGIGRRYQPGNDQFAASPVGGERPRNIRSLLQRLCQSDGIFHRQPSSGANGKMRRVQYIAHEHTLSDGPAFIPNLWKLPPNRFVRHWAMPRLST